MKETVIRISPSLLEQSRTMQKVFTRCPTWFLDKSSLNNHNQRHAYHRASCFLQIANSSQDPLISFEVLGWKIFGKKNKNSKYNTKQLLDLVYMKEFNGISINLDVKLAGRGKLLYLPFCTIMHAAILTQTIKWNDKSKTQKQSVYIQVSFSLHTLLRFFNSLTVFNILRSVDFPAV